MSGWQIQDESILLKNSALQILVGECIGSGASRHTYALPHDDTLVLKVEHSGCTFHNQMEYLIWEEMRNWPIKDWFAPCVNIDGYGNVLIQKRTEPFDSHSDFKAALQRTRGGVIPAVFDDVHWGNFGMYDGRVVCHDYGYTHFFHMMAREMSIEAGYIKKLDDDYQAECKPHDFTEGGQLALDL